MTRRPRKAKAVRKGRKPARRVKPASRDPLDDFIAAGSAALGLTIDKAWLRSNIEVTLRLGALVTDFALPDDAEPGPLFRA